MRPREMEERAPAVPQTNKRIANDLRALVLALGLPDPFPDAIAHSNVYVDILKECGALGDNGESVWGDEEDSNADEEIVDLCAAAASVSTDADSDETKCKLIQELPCF